MIVTFYSYKGGVGRSMAMANVADILARRGARVLMVDFDLEAPGLEQYFAVPQESARAHDGLIDLLVAFKEAMAVGGASNADFRDVERFIFPIYQKLPSGGSLDLLPAGRREGADLDRYATAVRSFDWQDFYFNWEGELFFEWLRDELTTSRYDLVLVDSRTGVTEMGGICSYQLADQMVMMCAGNRQNLRGTQNVVDDFTSPRVMARRRDRPLGILVVPARIEQRDPALLEAFLADFDAAFQSYFPARLKEAHLGTRELMIPYEAAFAFEERVVTDPVRSARRIDLSGAFLEIARAITLLAPPGSRIAGLEGSSAPDNVAPEYDLTTRFGGYDVHLVGSAASRADLERVKGSLEAGGLTVFLDAVEPVPPTEWRRRSEQILFHSKIMVVVSRGMTMPQQEAVASLVRANRGTKNRPVLVFELDREADGHVAAALELSGRAVHTFPEGPNEVEVRNAVADGLAAAASSPVVPPAAARVSVPKIVPPSAPTVASSQPFRGADPFREDVAGYFFGRERLVSDLVAAIASNPRVWLLGPSGCGKTSAILAGLFPVLRGQAPGRWLERIEVGPNPVATIRAAIARATSGGARGVLVVDEFERALDLPVGEQANLFTEIVSLTTGRPDVVVLLSVREDAAAALQASPLALRLTGPETIRVPDFTTGELRAAIERPAERSGLAYEPGLVERILADAGPQASVLRLVQRALVRLWEHRREGWLTNAGYQKTGGIGSVVGEIGDAAISGYRGDGAVLDRILGRLVALEPAAPGSPSATAESPAAPSQGMVLRRRLGVRVSEVLPADGDAAPYREALGQLTNAGLVVARANDANEPCVELVHDLAVDRSAVLSARLVAIVGKDREFLLWRQRLGAGLAQREGVKGSVLRAAKTWLTTHRGDLNALERRAVAEAKRALFIQRTALVVIVGMILFFVLRERGRDKVLEGVATVAAADDLAGRQQWGAVIDTLSSAINRYPFRDSLLLKRGRAHAALGDYQAATNDFTEALAANPLMIDALAERASANLRAGNFQRAITDYNAILQRGSRGAMSAAYYGRAVARDRLRGNLDSSLADFDSAYATDPIRIDAIFERGSLNQRLGRRSAAIRDFERVQSLATNPNDREAADARLKELQPSSTPSLPPRASVDRATVFLHFKDPNDAKAITLIRDEIARAGAFRVPSPEVEPNGPDVGEVRFLQGDDQYVKDVLVATERALAKNGYRLRLAPRPLNPKRFPGVKPGRIEVWLPALSQTLYSAEQKR